MYIYIFYLFIYIYVYIVIYMHYGSRFFTIRQQVLISRIYNVFCWTWELAEPGQLRHVSWLNRLEVMVRQ